jgi:hypothetical protein
MKNLFLDDLRQPSECYGYMIKRIGAMAEVYNFLEWDVVKSHEEFCKYITDNGIPEFISFDHDLADSHYTQWIERPDLANKRIFKEGTGLDSAIWLKNYCETNDKPFPKSLVHSMNPVGAQKIIEVIRESQTNLINALVYPLATNELKG